MSIAWRTVPSVIRRRVAQHSENLQASGLGQASNRLALADQVWPLFRPDVEGVAYYEFTLSAASRGTGQRLATRGWTSASVEVERMDAALEKRPDVVNNGFVVASAGEHDVPIPHFSFDRLAPSARLAQERKGDGRFARIYRLDALAYVAEDEAGELLARIGQLPPLPIDVAVGAGERGRWLGSVVAAPTRAIDDDARAADTEHVVRRSGTKDQLRFAQIDNWKEYRQVYGRHLGPLLEAHRRRAAPAWQTQHRLEEFGEGIFAGQSLRVALLEPQAAIRVTGRGAGYVDASLLERGGSSAVELRTTYPSEKHEVDFRLQISYASGEREDLPFFIVASDAPSNAKALQIEVIS